MSDELTEYAKKFFERPYETIYGVKDNKDGKSITIFSIWDTTHPECPITLIDVPRGGSE